MSHVKTRDAGGGSLRRLVAIVLLVLGFVGGVLWVTAPDAETPTTAARRALGREATRRLPAVTPPEKGGPHAFMQTTADDEPVGYDPCRTVTVRMNPQDAPKNAGMVVEQAIYDLSTATGLEIVLGEDTDERPILSSIGTLETTYEDGSSEDPAIVVVWSGRQETPTLRRGTVGVGGSTAFATGDERPYYGRGAVALDTVPLTEALLRGDGFRRVTAVLEHELGHVLGLDHVKAADELMHASNLGRLELGRGDRTGLALLGAIPCA